MVLSAATICKGRIGLLCMCRFRGRYEHLADSVAVAESERHEPPAVITAAVVYRMAGFLSARSSSYPCDDGATGGRRAWPAWRVCGAGGGDLKPFWPLCHAGDAAARAHSTSLSERSSTRRGSWSRTGAQLSMILIDVCAAGNGSVTTKESRRPMRAHKARGIDSVERARSNGVTY